MSYPSPLPTWPGLVLLSDEPTNLTLDLDISIGQRQATWAFQLINGVTGEVKGPIRPDRSATLSHDTTRTIKRQLSFMLGVDDTARVQTETDRVLVSMLVGGTTWPLGRYAFTSEQDATSTGGSRSSDVLLDEMTNVDQQLETGFPPVGLAGGGPVGVDVAVGQLLADAVPLPGIDVEPGPFPLVGSWSPGTTRGQVLAALAQQGDYETPWFDHNGIFRMIRTVNPAEATVTIDLDRGRRVIRDTILNSSTLLTAHNRFIVIGNGGDSQAAPIVGRYDVPPSAPNSISNIGFVRPSVVSAQVATADQANALARQLGIQGTITQTVQLTTVPDPRHDSYDVIRWQGVNWLEIGWSMQLVPGGQMTHTLRRSFT